MKISLDLAEDHLSRTPVMKAIASLAIGIVSISFAAIFIRFSEYELSPNATIFNRLWIAALALGLWKGLQSIGYRLSHQKPVELKLYTNQELWLLSGFGLFFAISQCLWAWSLTQTSVAISTILHNLTPISTSLGAWLLFGQHFDRRFLAGMIITVGGVTTIGLEGVQIASGEIKGDLAAILSAIFVSVYLLIAEQVRTKLTATTLLMWGSAIAALVILPILLLTEDQLFPSSWSGWSAVIGLAIICQVLGQGLIAHSLNKLSSGLVALSFLFDPVLTSTEAWAIFSEQLNFSDWITFVVVLLGIYLALSSQSAVKATVD